MSKKNPPYYTYQKEFNNFREMVKETTEKYSDDIVYSFRVKPHDEPTKISYRTLGENVRALGTRALADGYHGAHIALIGRLSYSWVCVYLAMLSVGAVIVPLDPDWADKDLCDTLDKSECTAVFCTADVRQKLGDTALTVYSLDGDGDDSLDAYIKSGAQLVEEGDSSFDTAEIDPTILAELVYTSGTTGKGKGVMLSQKALLSNLAGAFAILKISKKTIATLPPHHTYGSTISLLSAFCNGTESYISSGLRYLPAELAEQKPEHMILVPLYLETFYRKIQAGIKKSGKEKTLKNMIAVSNGMRKVGIDIRHQLFSKTVLSAFGGNLRRVVCGGAPISQEIIDAFDNLGVQVLNGYGITECSPLISANRLTYGGAGSVGVPIPNEEVLIYEPNEYGEGEICIRGPHVMLGYFKDEAATADAIDSDGFFHTGDIGKYENDLVYITGRKKNLIILSNGKNVYPEEIESALETVPGISEIVVYEGVSRRGGEHNAIVAEIFPDASYLEQAGIADAEAYFSPFVDDYNRHAVPYKKIERLKIRTEEFPKNTLRKIMRFKIDKEID